MNITHFSTRLNDGAGRGAYRLHQGLIDLGLNSTIITKHEGISNKNVIQLFRNNTSGLGSNDVSQNSLIKHSFHSLRFLFQEFKQRHEENKWVPKVLFNFNMPFVNIEKVKTILKNSDIICLHSIQYFLSSEVIKKIHSISNAPIVWTLWDIEPITGGCHFNDGCEKYAQNCGDCPQLHNNGANDLSRIIFNQKKHDFQNLPITFVTVSENSRVQVKKSSLFNHSRVEKILVGMEKEIYSTIDISTARKVLNIPLEKKVILFGCFNLDDYRKGGHLLIEACKKMPEIFENDQKNIRDNFILVTFGSKNHFDASNIPFDWMHLDTVRDNISLNLIYNASDVFACPSIDDIGPMMINEAYMCNTPIVAFDTGVGPDLIVDNINGFIITNKDVSEFSKGLYNCLMQDTIQNNRSNVSVERNICSTEYQAESYLKLFKDLLSTK